MGGGGLGAIDSRGVKGGQGQDFTLDRFARGGIEPALSGKARISAGITFQRLSNGAPRCFEWVNPATDMLWFPSNSAREDIEFLWSV